MGGLWGWSLGGKDREGWIHSTGVRRLKGVPLELRIILQVQEALYRHLGLATTVSRPSMLAVAGLVCSESNSALVPP